MLAQGPALITATTTAANAARVAPAAPQLPGSFLREGGGDHALDGPRGDCGEGARPEVRRLERRHRAARAHAGDPADNPVTFIIEIEID